MSSAAQTRSDPRKLSVPPLGLAAALMLWGLEIQLWPYALAMGVVLEVARATPWRWRMSEKDFERLADATGIGFLMVVIYVFDTYSFQGVYVILQWLPFILFLLALAQRFGTTKGIRYSALFLSVRRAERKGTIEDAGSIDFDLPYLVVCLVAATAGEVGGAWLFAGLVAVTLYVLWYNRPRHFHLALWTGAAVLAVGLGYLNQVGMIEARRVIEPIVMNYFRDRIMNYRNPFRSYTAMGEIGRLKQSDRILFRVESLDGGSVPALLHEATYRSFSKNIWLAGNTAFQEQISDLEGTSWDIEYSPIEGSHTVRISQSLTRGRGLLVLPRGTFRIDNLPVEELHRHSLGAFRVNRGPGLVRYTATYMPGQAFELLPGPEDLLVPREFRPLMSGIASELELNGAPPAKVLKTLQRFFLSEFEYSVDLRRPGPVATPLHNFLLHSRSGHCEFFASSTVLLLRSLGIPARYATGYSVQEYSPLERSYVVRKRHAHSWALAFISGRWIDFDTTPPSWGAMEAAAAPWWESGYDFFSWLLFQFSRWRWSGDEDTSSNHLLWLIAPLLALLLWRIVRSNRDGARLRPERRQVDRGVMPGADSDFYRLLRTLEKRGISRAPGEPLSRWLRRLRERGGDESIREIVDAILPIHYRYRFDPKGLNSAERNRLRRKVRVWLGRHPA